MKIDVVGGGPGGLFAAILLKKSLSDARITVHERNRADDTFGWGVVFSDETLGNIEAADPPSIQEIRRRFRYWDDIHTFFGPNHERVVSTGHGFCGMSRKELLQVMQARATEVGVDLRFEVEIDPRDPFEDSDLVIAADGVNSQIREAYAEHFRPTIDWRKCKFAWYGTDLELEAFTFVFKENEHGLFQVHAYPFTDGLSTWIVECHEDTWKRAGLDTMSTEDSLKYCEALFAEDLHGHKLLDNRSIWRTFPTVRNETWRHGKIVLLGDSAHTAHFSIGSGTKLALEDAIALHAAVVQNPGEVSKALAAYEEDRYIDVVKLQKAAQTSLEWFENSDRYLQQDPVTFSFNLMTRSKRITYDNLALRDPQLVAQTTEVFAAQNGIEAVDGTYAPPMFAPFQLRDLRLPNRVVVSPMCQYSAKDGMPDDWHLVHLGSRAIGGAGLVITEMTDVSPDGRITPGCTGIWSQEHALAWQRIVEFVHQNSQAKICMQLAHAGRKGSVFHPWQGDDVPLRDDEGPWETIAPSAIPFRPEWRTPREMTRADMDRVRDDFVRAAEFANDAGFDMVELHMAHGYLLSSFLSPLSNHRTDDYGGSLENRLRFPLEVLDAVRAAWPDDRPVSVRITASDWAGDEGLTGDDAVAIARALGEHGCDVVDVSSGGNSAEHIPEYGRMYQVPFAERIKYETGLPVMAVGAIQGPDHCNTLLAAQRVDLCAMARPHLYDPYLTLHAAAERGVEQGVEWPGQYLLGRRPPPAKATR